MPVTKESNNTEYTLTSLSVNEINASFAAAAIRGHWEIENKLHYVKDQNLREDDSVAYKNGISHKHALLNSQAVGVLSLVCSYERKKQQKNITCARLQQHLADNTHKAIGYMTNPI